MTVLITLTDDQQTVVSWRAEILGMTPAAYIQIAVDDIVQATKEQFDALHIRELAELYKELPARDKRSVLQQVESTPKQPRKDRPLKV